VLPCIVIRDIFLNNQPDALIIPNLLSYKTLGVSVIFSAYHQKFSTVHLAVVSFMQVFDGRFQAESGLNYSHIHWLSLPPVLWGLYRWQGKFLFQAVRITTSINSPCQNVVYRTSIKFILS
jgi:hypothetical protein